REIALFLHELRSHHKPPTAVYLLGRPPTFETPKQLLDALRRITRRRTTVHFVPILESTDLEPEAVVRDDIKAQLARDALTHRQRLATEEGLKQLTLLGVKIAKLRREGRFALSAKATHTHQGEDGRGGTR